jgi:hypothetical protein
VGRKYASLEPVFPIFVPIAMVLVNKEGWLLDAPNDTKPLKLEQNFHPLLLNKKR